MQMQIRRLLFWAPRILGILFALFVSIFALDVFGEGYGFWGTVVAFLIHLIPVYVLLLALAVGWRWEWAGALLFAGFSVWYLVTSWSSAPLVANLMSSWPIALPSLVVGLLFLLNWLIKHGLNLPTKMAH